MVNCGRHFILTNMDSKWSNLLYPNCLRTLVEFYAICYTYTRIQPKGKPQPQIVADAPRCLAYVVRRGPRLRSNAFALSCAGPDEVPKRKFWNEAWAKLQGPSCWEGQPVTANECVSFAPSTETYPSDNADGFFVSRRGSKQPQHFDSSHKISNIPVMNQLG